MAAYDNEMMKEDIRKAARTLHAAYARCCMVRERWANGPSTSIANSGATAKFHTFMTLADELVTGYQANTNAKLNSVMMISDLTLPGQ